MVFISFNIDITVIAATATIDDNLDNDTTDVAKNVALVLLMRCTNIVKNSNTFEDSQNTKKQKQQYECVFCISMKECFCEMFGC